MRRDHSDSSPFDAVESAARRDDSLSDVFGALAALLLVLAAAGLGALIPVVVLAWGAAF